MCHSWSPGKNGFWWQILDVEEIKNVIPFLHLIQVPGVVKFLICIHLQRLREVLAYLGTVFFLLGRLWKYLHNVQILFKVRTNTWCHKNVYIVKFVQVEQLLHRNSHFVSVRSSYLEKVFSFCAAYIGNTNQCSLSHWLLELSRLLQVFVSIWPVDKKRDFRFPSNVYWF